MKAQQPGEEHLVLRARWKGVTGARKGAVIGLVAAAAALLTLMVYGIITAGRTARTDAAVAQEAPSGSGGGKWINDVPDTPRGAAPQAQPKTPPQTPPKQDLPADKPKTPAAAENVTSLHPGSGAAPGPAPPKPLTPEEQYRLEVERKRREDHLAALVASPVGNQVATAPRSATLPEGASTLAFNGDGRGFASSQRNSGSDGEAQNQQAEKAAFLKAAEAHTPGYLDEARTAPLGPYEVKAGSIIPAVLLSGINSDLPGAVVAQVRETVYDYVSARHVLIPQGSRLVGRYDSQIAYGQERVLVVWERILFPDGSSLAIKGMPGVDGIGQGGASDEVDNHYGKLLGGVILSSILGVGAQVAYGPKVNTSDPSIGQLAMEGVAGNVNQVGQQITRKNLNVQPTLVIRPGYLFNVLVTRDLVLPVYASHGPQP
ncbi:MAG TPA: TrbI/VirB10 family protein [Candidatus Competibacteraceae bacterium]|nr:TrbI/VirB10 family protein [Candidatus Competibacteraceae bacterium]